MIISRHELDLDKPVSVRQIASSEVFKVVFVRVIFNIVFGILLLG